LRAAALSSGSTDARRPRLPRRPDRPVGERRQRVVRGRVARVGGERGFEAHARAGQIARRISVQACLEQRLGAHTRRGRRGQRRGRHARRGGQLRESQHAHRQRQQQEQG
jgi:hypothetical protein